MREFTARGIRLSEPELFVPFSYPVWPHPENRKPRMCHCAQSGFLCAGINRHGVEDERALRVRTSDPLGLESCASPIVR